MRVGRDGKVSKGLERTVFDVSNGRSFYGPGEAACIHIWLARGSELVPVTPSRGNDSVASGIAGQS
jgi:hypothetical protein